MNLNLTKPLRRKVDNITVDFIKKYIDLSVVVFSNGGCSIYTDNDLEQYLENIPEVWKPKDEEVYYQFDEYGNTVQTMRNAYAYDVGGYDFGNCFPSEEIATRARDLVKQTLLEFRESNWGEANDN